MALDATTLQRLINDVQRNSNGLVRLDGEIKLLQKRMTDCEHDMEKVDGEVSRSGQHRIDELKEELLRLDAEKKALIVDAKVQADKLLNEEKVRTIKAEDDARAVRRRRIEMFAGAFLGAVFSIVVALLLKWLTK